MTVATETLEARSPEDPEWPVCIVVSLDRPVLVGAAVAIRSALEGIQSGCKVEVYVFYDGLDKKDMKELELSWSDIAPTVPDPEITFVPIREEMFSGLIRSKAVSRMAYCILIMADFLPSVSRALYLDTDCIVRTDISALFRLQIGENLAAGVPDGSHRHGEAQLRRLGVDPTLGYYNTGVVLADLEGWRETEVGRASLRFVEDRQPKMHDQDALNAVLAGKWTTLPESWNMWASRLKGPAEEFDGIIHSTGVPKPWHADYDGPVQELFHETVSRTQLAGRLPRSWLGVARLIARVRRRLPYVPTVWRLVKGAVKKK